MHCFPGEKLQYKRWAPGEPGGNPSLNCGFFFFTNASVYGLADGNCKHEYRYICEREDSAPGYECARRDVNLTAVHENNASESHEKDPPANQEIDSSQPTNQQKNQSARQGNNQSISQQKNPFSNKVNNQSVNQQKNSSASQEANQSSNQEQNEAANEGENPMASWKKNPSTGYIDVPRMGHYKLHDVSERSTWHEAYATCAREGSHLLILDSEEEQNVITTMIEMSRTRGRLHWLGFHDQFQEREYITVCSKYKFLGGSVLNILSLMVIQEFVKASLYGT